MIQGELECSEVIAGRGGISEVRKGIHEGEEVAVKCIMFNQHVTSEKVMKVICIHCRVQAVDSPCRSCAKRSSSGQP